MPMCRVALRQGADLAGFRRAVRALVAEGVAPQEVLWSSDSEPELFAAAPAGEAPPVVLPRAVAALIGRVICHHDPERYALLYDLTWRVLHGERALLEMQSDPLVHRLDMLDKAVARDLHRMHAFLRFRRVPAEDRLIAWFDPEHDILHAAADFFVERFRALRWSILTPIGSMHWDGRTLAFGPPGRREDVPQTDAFEAGWRGYYESTFNPARSNPKAMRAEMPKRYWRNMPETAAIPDLIRSAPACVEAMIAQQTVVPIRRSPDKAVAAMAGREPKTLAELNRGIVAAGPLVPGATQAVLGEGPVGAAIAFVGEQPGDQEDVEGRPFVGPAGQLLSRAMAEAGIDRAGSYLTNAVKHFKFEQRGKRRIHQTPTVGEVKHYRWWLMKELDLVQPHLVVALGATAVLALAGRPLPVIRSRGVTRFAGHAGFITVHPSYLLRLPDEAARQQGYADFVADLAQIRAVAAEPPRLAAG